MSQGKRNVVFVLGPPGSGKSTECAKIEESFGFVHLSADDLLLQERNTPSSRYSQMIDSNIREGIAIPGEITCSLLETSMGRAQDSGMNNFLVDGFPGNQDDLDGWTQRMATSDDVNLLFVLFLTCSEEICIPRCADPESAKKRIVTFNNDTMPIINNYIELNMAHTVDAAQDVDTVFQGIKPFFESVASGN